jgi:S-adenosylmethionine hydrolase
LAVAAGGHFFVGPDNGSLSTALSGESRRQRGAEEDYEARMVEARGVDAVRIEARKVNEGAISATFEGRDVFARAAAALANGTALAALGEPAPEMLAFPAFAAPMGPRGLAGIVLRVDRFGNLITDIRGEGLAADARVVTAGRELRRARTYAEFDELAAIVGSSGYVEIAAPNGSAAAALGLAAGARVEALNA